MRKKDVHPANDQIRPMKEEDLDAGAVINSMPFGASRTEYCREKPGWVAKGLRNAMFWVTGARTAILPGKCKRLGA